MEASTIKKTTMIACAVFVVLAAVRFFEGSHNERNIPTADGADISEEWGAFSPEESGSADRVQGKTTTPARAISESNTGFRSFTQSRNGEGSAREAKRPEAADLTGLTTNVEKIAKILASTGEQKILLSDDPRFEQLKALGDSAVNDLLDAYDIATALAIDDETQWVKETLLKKALLSMLGPDDKEIILTYFREKRDFSELVWKYRFPEAGVIAFQNLSQDGLIEICEGRYRLPTSDAEVAAALYPEVAIPWMVKNAASPERPGYMDYISAVAKHAPAVDLRPALRQTINASLTDENIPTHLDDWARLALVRSMPEGLDASVQLLRKSESKYTQQSALAIVRNYIPFRGPAAQTADWIEKNRATLSPEPQLPYGILAPGKADQIQLILDQMFPDDINQMFQNFPDDIMLHSPFAPESGGIHPGDQKSGTVVECPYTGKTFLFP